MVSLFSYKTEPGSDYKMCILVKFHISYEIFKKRNIMDKKRKVSSAMEPYVRFVLQRDKIPFSVEQNGNDYLFAIPVSSRRFTEVIEDALCEKQRESYLSRIPVYSARTLKNREKLKRLMRLNNRQGYHVLAADQENYYKFA